jgi:hypothetical protein
MPATPATPSLRRVACICCLYLASLLLAACGNTDLKEELGLTHRSPDEFLVYQHPALSVPPDYDLRPPGNGSQYIVGTPTDQQAHNEILGVDSTGAVTPMPDAQASSPFTAPGTSATAVTPVSAAPLPSTSDAQFLTDIGAQNADPNVRRELQGNMPSASKSSSYLFTPGSDAPSTVDAAKEAARIQQDKAQNQPITTGDTPVVVPQDKGILGSIESIF